MDTKEMEFQWRLNWWYRPTQLNDFETSVVDYYDCFCDWKDSMVINSCPADEADYVAAFIQNLRYDIRSRLESKGRTRTRRLSDVYSDAKFEESLIFLEEAFKMIKAKFEAHELFDKLPSQVSDVYQEHSSDEVDSCLHVSSAGYCSNKLAEDLSDDEFSGLEDDDESESGEQKDFNGKMDLHNGVDEVFDEFSEPDIEEMPHPNSINLDAVHGSSNDMSIEEHGDVDKVQKSKPNGGLKPFAPGVQCMNRAMKFDLEELETPELISTEHFEEHNGNDNSTPLIVYVRRVFDPGSGTTEHICPNGSTILEIEGTFTPLLVYSLISLKDIGAAIMLSMPWPSLQPVFFSSRFGNESIEESFSCMKEIEAVMLLLGSMEVTHKMLDKFPQPLVVTPSQKMFTENSYILPLSPLFGCVPQNFDPGSVYLNIICSIIDLNGVNGDFDIMLDKPNGELWIGKMYGIQVFDPGGSSWVHMVWCSMKINVDKQDFGFRVGLVSPYSALSRFNSISVFGIVLSMNVDTMAIIGLFVYMTTVVIALRNYSVEALDKFLGKWILVFGIMIKSEPNAYSSVLLLDGGSIKFTFILSSTFVQRNWSHLCGRIWQISSFDAAMRFKYSVCNSKNHDLTDTCIDKAVECTMVVCFWINEQICSATACLLIHESFATQFLNRLADRCNIGKVSDPLMKSCILGPIIGQGQIEAVILRCF